MLENSQWDPNAPIICPYDETHVIAVKRFQRHLVKCRKNHPDKDFVTCPFNARHTFLRSELQKHLAFCADRVSLDTDVLQEEDPETGDMLRLKGKTDMPKAPENIPISSEDWDDEIEENLATKYVEQEEYLRSQGIVNGRRPDDEPLLRRPILPIVNSPHLPSLNQPVFESGPLTSLRRPNIPTTENNATSENNLSVNIPTTVNISSQSSSTDSDSEHSATRLFLNQKRLETNSIGITDKSGVVNNAGLNQAWLNPEKRFAGNTENNIYTKTENSVDPKTEIRSRSVPLSLRYKTMLAKETNANSVRDTDTESITESVFSDSSWASSVYEPIKRNRLYLKPSTETYDRESSPCSEDMKVTLNSTLPPDEKTLDLHETHNNNTSRCNSTGESKSMRGVGHGNYSAFTTVVPTNTDTLVKCQPPVAGRGLIGLPKNASNGPGKGLGRGNLKLAAMNFKTS